MLKSLGRTGSLHWYVLQQFWFLFLTLLPIAGFIGFDVEGQRIFRSLTISHHYANLHPRNSTNKSQFPWESLLQTSQSLEVASAYSSKDWDHSCPLHGYFRQVRSPVRWPRIRKPFVVSPTACSLGSGKKK